MLAKLNVKCRDDDQRHILTLLQAGVQHTAQLLPALHLLRLALHRAQGRPSQWRPLPKAPLLPQDVHGIFQCHRCRWFGHMIRDCPNKRTLLIRDNGEYSSASDSEETSHAMIATNHAENEEVHVDPIDADRYESLVVQRVLSTQVAQAEKNQRHTLFHTKGVVHERSIRIIIDSGSCNNLASTALVEKLSLPTRSHPHPYHIQWLNDGGKIKVTRSVRVPFSLGSYSDYADCDVIPMEACSLLLGRPWQYDTDSLHHGRSNHYSFMFKGQKIIIHPMTPDQILKDDLTRAAKTAQQVKSTSAAPIKS